MTATGIRVPPELERMMTSLARPAVLFDRALGETIQEALPGGVIGEARGRAARFGRMQSTAAGGLAYETLPNGVRLTGQGPFFMGAEFGGRKKPPQTVIMTSRRGKRYSARRKTTNQFLPFLGHVGYFLTPAYRQHLQGIRQKLLDRLAEEVTGA